MFKTCELNNIGAYDYHLPEGLIAQYPPEIRGASRLLVSGRRVNALSDRVFTDIADILDDGYFLVVNNTRVVPARMQAVKDTGGKSEVFFLEQAGINSCKALIRGKVRRGDKIKVGNDVVTLEERFADGSWLISSTVAVETLMDKYGKLPLPPYIQREPREEDSTRYQTVYAAAGNSVAAPTAGLHFTDELLNKLADKGIEIVELTLDVGIGTFRPIKTDNLDEHKMHTEKYSISSVAADTVNRLKKSGKKLLAVGTTSVRALESAAGADGMVKPGEGGTDLFIRPGYDFKTVDAVLTNFHLPKSSLLVMISAFMGMDFRKKAYEHAVGEKYNFFSYGDAMLIL